MVESKAHKEMRKEVEKRLEEKEVDFISSHSPDSEGVGPILYLGDPVEKDCSRSALRISQPDILVEKEEGTISVIEIEREAKTPKYILGDVYAVLHSECYSDEVGRVKELDEVDRIYILIAEERAKKGVKARQYDLLVGRLGSDLEVDFKVFWGEEVEELVEKSLGF